MHTFMDPDFAKDAVYFQARGIGGRIWENARSQNNQFHKAGASALCDNARPKRQKTEAGGVVLPQKIGKTRDTQQM